MPDTGSGLMASVRRLLSTLVSIASTRLELLANELQEERLRLTQMLLFGLFALFCFGLGILLLTVFIVVLFWDDHRLAVVGALTVVFFALGLLMVLLLRNKAKAKSRLFSASLAELDKDREHLGASQDRTASHE
ncbi:MAG: phage holin family protein [Nitrosomonadales bacterium]|nr:phage holin family protein [Nitrosomonadales bacterium]